MIPILLAAAGAYLIANSQKDNQIFAKGGQLTNVEEKGFSVGDIVKLKNIPENLPKEIRLGIVDNKWQVIRVSMSGRSMYSDVMEDIFGYDIMLIDTSIKMPSGANYILFVYPNKIMGI